MEILEKTELVKTEVEKFYQQAEEWDPIINTMNTSQKQHIIQIGTSILCTKWDIGYPGGGFVQAVVNNNLIEAVSKADVTNIKALKFYCQLMYNVGMPSKLINNL